MIKGFESKTAAIGNFFNQLATRRQIHSWGGDIKWLEKHLPSERINRIVQLNSAFTLPFFRSLVDDDILTKNEAKSLYSQDFFRINGLDDFTIRLVENSFSRFGEKAPAILRKYAEGLKKLTDEQWKLLGTINHPYILSGTDGSFFYGKRHRGFFLYRPKGNQEEFNFDIDINRIWKSFGISGSPKLIDLINFNNEIPPDEAEFIIKNIGDDQLIMSVDRYSDKPKLYSYWSGNDDRKLDIKWMGIRALLDRVALYRIHLMSQEEACVYKQYLEGKDWQKILGKETEELRSQFKITNGQLEIQGKSYGYIGKPIYRASISELNSLLGE